MPVKKIKICVLGTRGFPNIQGGVEAHCENLYPLLAEKGCEVAVFTRQPYTGSNLPYDYKGVRLIPLPCPKNKIFEAFWHTFHGVLAAKKLAPDILHIQAIGPSLLAPLARCLGLKVVMTHHGPDYQRKKWGWASKLILRYGEFSGIKWSNRIIAISDEIAGKINDAHRHKAYVIPNGVPELKTESRNDALAEYGLEKNKYILSVGRFVPEKGFLDLIDAFLKLAWYYPQWEKEGWKLVIAGQPDHHNAYSQKIEEEAGKNPQIILTGFLKQEKLRQLYRSAGIFVLPSYYEGLPIALLEALGFGLSCLASDIIANRGTGIALQQLFPAGDSDCLAQKIAAQIRQPLTDTEKEEQILWVKQKYDWQKIAEKTLAVYQSVLKNEIT